MNKSKKIPMILFMFLLVFFSIGMLEGSEAHAATDELFTTTYGDYKNQQIFYDIDYIDTTELEDESFFDKYINVFDNVSNWVIAFVFSMISGVFVAFPFMLMRIFTSGLIWTFNKVYEVNFVNEMVDGIATSVQNVAGISGLGFGKTGLFGGFLGIITASIAIYTLYQFIVKRASITAFSGLLKSLMCLVLALLFFSNYSTIIKGLNSLSVEASGLILSGGSILNGSGTIENKSLKEQMNETIWNTFVHKPYLMLQYGTMNESEIGRDRINKLLEKRPLSEERYDLVKEEVKNQKNDMMTRGKIFERWSILIIAFLANLVNSIPIMILSFALIFFQFWFTAMGMIAPFAFVISAFPNQFRILGRYLVELITPLVLKMAVAVLALFVFSLTSIISNVSMNSANNDGLLGYIFMVFCQAILLFTLWLLRHRILNIFSFGSKQLDFIRQGMSETFTQPFKKGVQTTTTVGGAVIGGVTGGLKGAMMGANIGSDISRALTGDQSVGDTMRDIALTKLYHDRMNLNSNSPENSIQNQTNTDEQQDNSTTLDTVEKVQDNQGDPKSPQNDEVQDNETEETQVEYQDIKDVINDDNSGPVNDNGEDTKEEIPLQDMKEINESDEVKNHTENNDEPENEQINYQNMEDVIIGDNSGPVNDDNETKKEEIPLQNMDEVNGSDGMNNHSKNNAESHNEQINYQDMENVMKNKGSENTNDNNDSGSETVPLTNINEGNSGKMNKGSQFDSPETHDIPDINKGSANQEFNHDGGNSKPLQKLDQNFESQTVDTKSIPNQSLDSPTIGGQSYDTHSFKEQPIQSQTSGNKSIDSQPIEKQSIESQNSSNIKGSELGSKPIPGSTDTSSGSFENDTNTQMLNKYVDKKLEIEGKNTNKTLELEKEISAQKIVKEETTDYSTENLNP